VAQPGGEQVPEQPDAEVFGLGLREDLPGNLRVRGGPGLRGRRVGEDSSNKPRRS
jgi:hypothetical protein